MDFEITIFNDGEAQDTYLVDLKDHEDLGRYIIEELEYLTKAGWCRPSISVRMLAIEKR